MSEPTVINSTDKPLTRESLARNLEAIGVEKGDMLLVHLSMKSLGWVVGGPVTVLHALMDVLTDEGTLVIQTHTPSISDPAEWENPPVPKEWHDTIRKEMPLFEPARTPSTYLGVIPELFRTWPGVFRSNHPTFSIGAWGKHAKRLTERHPLHYGLNEESPLGVAYRSNAKVLLIGVGYDSNTSFHLSEHKAGTNKQIKRGAPLLIDGTKEWMTYDDIELDEEQFVQIGEDYERNHPITRSNVGQADSRLFPMKEAVDFATSWLKRKGEENANT
ncbi:aminoglycoside N(3)-acetyltransferase [Thalassobacillus hwangdonensis]|uniref:Aminoglycoside N(3)-acetyltransferase n=1 Tax=Thalassobacillus hwangdonensis TaxID=546108 RepID=A0ABW3L460_9BACI